MRRGRGRGVRMVGGDGREDGMDGYPDIGSRSRGKR